ncbi:hypothetical protein BY458DRAFT_564855 [Sporodiniella umbellata]|nr:hypothetical protein BY458DRAFT_564855 [Sporodiniella umbellata]
MNVHFIYKNAKDKIADESGNMNFEIDTDTEIYPIDYFASYKDYLDCKSPEKKKLTKNQA